MRCICAGIDAGMRLPAMLAWRAPIGSGAEQTIKGAKADDVFAGRLRSGIGSWRESPLSKVTSRNGQGSPAGSTARATSPDATSVLGAATL
ncbi:MAG: hypothetical protein KGR25_11535 [Chloroflexi bacterium]|nr:hypothetical protein [Chloroflexota bacterium]